VTYKYRFSFIGLYSCLLSLSHKIRNINKDLVYSEHRSSHLFLGINRRDSDLHTHIYIYIYIYTLMLSVLQPCKLKKTLRKLKKKASTIIEIYL